MFADGAGLGRAGGVGDHIAAVEAHPVTFHLVDKQLVLLHQVGKLAEAVAVDLLDAGDLGEDMGNFREALLLGGVGEGGVIVLVLLILVVLGGTEMLLNGVVKVDGVSAVNGDIFPGAFFQIVVEYLGVLLLLMGGEAEDRLDDIEAVLFGQTGGEGVAVAGLTLSGEGPEEVSFCLTFCKVNGHGISPFLWMGKVCPVFGGIYGVGSAVAGRLGKIETAGEKTQGFGQGAEFIGQLHDDRFPVVMADGGDGKHMGADDIGLPVGERETGFGVFQSLGGMVQKVPPKAGKATVHPVVEVEVVEKGAPGGFPGVPAQSAAKAKADLRDPDAVAVAAEACTVLGKGVHGPDRLVGQKIGDTVQPVVFL